MTDSFSGLHKYRTILADPPWEYEDKKGDQVESDIDLNEIQEMV